MPFMGCMEATEPFRSHELHEGLNSIPIVALTAHVSEWHRHPDPLSWNATDCLLFFFHHYALYFIILLSVFPIHTHLAAASLSTKTVEKTKMEFNANVADTLGSDSPSFEISAFNPTLFLNVLQTGVSSIRWLRRRPASRAACSSGGLGPS